jgi:hypothetical protein
VARKRGLRTVKRREIKEAALQWTGDNDHVFDEIMSDRGYEVSVGFNSIQCRKYEEDVANLLSVGDYFIFSPYGDRFLTAEQLHDEYEIVK